MADLLTSEVASRLVLILKRLDFFDIKVCCVNAHCKFITILFYIKDTQQFYTFALLSQWMAAKILSCLSFSKCSDVIEEAVPVLLETISDDIDQVAVEVICSKLVSHFN